MWVPHSQFGDCIVSHNISFTEHDEWQKMGWEDEDWQVVSSRNGKFFKNLDSVNLFIDNVPKTETRECSGIDGNERSFGNF